MKKTLQIAILLLYSCLSHAGQDTAHTKKPEQAIGFHFYGALDCPPCMKFKRDYLQSVQKKAKQTGFFVSTNIIERTEDVSKFGAYGNRDALLREAGKQLPFVYPPIFFVTYEGVTISAYLGNWQAALKQSIALSQREL